MMSVLEYAKDIGRPVEEVLKKCKELHISVTNEDDLLDEDAITELDNTLNSEEVLDGIVEKIIEKKDIEVDNTIKKEKLKKKPVYQTRKKQEDLAIKKKAMYKNKEKLVSNTPVDTGKIVSYKENMTISELAKNLGVNAAELLKKLFDLGVVANVNTTINFENAEILVVDYGKELKKEETLDVTNFEDFEIKDEKESLVSRPPVVTIMGHVDHGKTTLLDYIKKTKVAETEAGGITQAISAYQVDVNGKKITFIDTPGHAAFTEMRARGAKVTDIIIIIVAADDGVMPQTREVIDHAKAANVPIIVAINKIDIKGIKLDKIMQDLSDCGLMPDSWGGDTLYNKISAKTGEGVDELLENILLISEMQDYKANPNRYAVGTVIETRLDKQVGPVVVALIENGTLRLGDPIVVGNFYGKVRTLKNDVAKEIMEATPSTPVEVIGLNGVPVAGDKFMAFESEKEARKVSEQRALKSKEKELKCKSNESLDDLFSKLQEGIKELNIIIKTDVHGSSEAVKASLEKLKSDNVRIKIVRSGVGNITESDVVLAKATRSILIGFNVKPNVLVSSYAKENCVEIKIYDIIYKMIEDIESALNGMLDPVYEEKIIGSAQVRKIFKFSKTGIIAGSYVTDGYIKSNSLVRVMRGGVVIHTGKINSIQREKDKVNEIKKGLECGLTVEAYDDIKVDDVLECYEMVQVK